MLRLQEIADYLGVSSQRAQQVARDGHHGFPEPIAEQPLRWRKNDVERWAKAEWWDKYRWRKSPGQP